MWHWGGFSPVRSGEAAGGHAEEGGGRSAWEQLDPTGDQPQSPTREGWHRDCWRRGGGLVHRLLAEEEGEGTRGTEGGCGGEGPDGEETINASIYLLFVPHPLAVFKLSGLTFDPQSNCVCPFGLQIHLISIMFTFVWFCFHPSLFSLSLPHSLFPSLPSIFLLITMFSCNGVKSVKWCSSVLAGLHRLINRRDPPTVLPAGEHPPVLGLCRLYEEHQRRSSAVISIVCQL